MCYYNKNIINIDIMWKLIIANDNKTEAQQVLPNKYVISI